MKTVLFILFGVLSALFAVGGVWISGCVRKDDNRTKRLFSAIQILTIGFFGAVVLLFVPIYYTGYDFGDAYSFVRPLLLALHNSLRIFILDGDFDIVVQSVGDQQTALRICFSAYAAILYVAAPILTFGNVLSLFKNLVSELRYKWHRYKKHYILSELNEKSVALAKSIYDEQKNAVIVFTDVFEQNEEDDYELLMQARDMNAICLKKDIAHLDFISKKGDVEIFLIGMDEAENVSQAVRITTELDKKNTKQNVKIFVFSTKPGASYIIDSIRYDNLLEYAGKHGYGEDCFKLRRIDEKQQLIWGAVPEMKLFDIANRNNKTLSVMIIGFGNYGMEFFKMLVWYCQFEGYKLQINVLDRCGKHPKEKNRIVSMINRDCPELLKKNRCEDDGEAHYDIEIFPGVDATTADIDELMLYEGDDPHKQAVAQRLRSTNLAFVAMGDDDIDIEVAVHMRSLFDRLNGVKANKLMTMEDESVDIYSVVYDDQKIKTLYDEQASEAETQRILNHKETPYHIRFIGGISSRFGYGNIYRADLERRSYVHHNSWVDAEEQIYNDWMAKGEQEKLSRHEWFFKAEKNENAVAEARKKYERFEYYRHSSIAKELYQQELNNNPDMQAITACVETKKKQTCLCKNCTARKKSEHMRWNAYTRTIGFSSSSYRADRAMLHDNLQEWHKLDELDMLKD